MVLTVYFALSPVTGLFCHRRLRTNVLSAPGRADITSANLTPASGRQDHTTSPYAAIVTRPRAVDRSQIFRPALRSPCAQNAAASTASLPAFVTMANAPLVGWDAKSSRCDLGGVKTEIFLQRGLDTRVNKPPDGQITTRRREEISLVSRMEINPSFPDVQLHIGDAPLGAGPESVLPTVVMDSGLAPSGAPRNDAGVDAEHPGAMLHSIIAFSYSPPRCRRAP